jgi:hypothetical protein
MFLQADEEDPLQLPIESRPAFSSHSYVHVSLSKQIVINRDWCLFDLYW